VSTLLARLRPKRLPNADNETSLNILLQTARNRSRGAPSRPSFASPQRHEKIRPRQTHDPEKWCPVFGQDHAQKRGRRSAERRMPTIPAQHQQTLPLVDVSARLRAKSGRARLPALRRGSRRDSHPCSAPGHASWDVDSARCEHHAWRKPADVTRPLLSQSSDSTSRLGRNTEGNDAQSRPGAGCKPARRHRTRSASESALAKASLDERDDVVYLIW